MSEFVETFDMSQFVDKYVERVSRHIDAEVLERVESELAGYGYMKVVRCRDCAKWHYFDYKDGVRYGECDEWKRADSYLVPATREDGFCYWGERKEVSE